MSLLQRLHQFFVQPIVPPVVATLYAACVAQARLPVFYRDLGAPDTLDGRFDLLLLHVFILMHRLQDAAGIKQHLFDLMFADMDRSLREMGVGDMSIGKKIRPMISAFYGREQAYRKALGESDEILAATLQRNLFGTVTVDPVILQKMARYVRANVAHLEKQDLADITHGKLTFTTPVL